MPCPCEEDKKRIQQKLARVQYLKEQARLARERLLEEQRLQQASQKGS